MIKPKISRTNLIISFVIIIFALLISLSISYYALYKFTFAGDRIIYGKKTSEVAREIREELLKRSDITSISFPSGPSKDALKLVGFFVKRENPAGTMVICHGYQSNKEFLYGYIDMFPDWNILLFDFRAHGQSAGKITSVGCHEYKDIIAAVQYLKTSLQNSVNPENHTQLPLVIIGISMGGAATLKAAEVDQDLCDAIIVDSTYANLNATILQSFSLKSKLPYYPFFPIIKQMFNYVANCDMSSMNPVESVQHIQKPILFIHSCDDTFISPLNAVRLYANSVNKKSEIWIGPRCRHGFLHCYYPRIYQEKVINFLDKALKK